MKSYATKLVRVCEISLRFQPPDTIITHLHSFKTITRFPCYFPSFSQLPRLIIFFLLKNLMGISILKIELKIMFGERKSPPWSEFAFKKKEKKVKVYPKLGGQRNVPMFGGQRKEKEKVLFHLFPLPPPSNFT
jgi:hypothetical protein